jgi:hypothetical protein
MMMVLTSTCNTSCILSDNEDTKKTGLPKWQSCFDLFRSDAALHHATGQSTVALNIRCFLFPLRPVQS